MGSQNITKEGVLENTIFSEFESVVILIVFHHVKLVNIIIHIGHCFSSNLDVRHLDLIVLTLSSDGGLAPPPEGLYRRDLGQIGILGGNWYFRWDDFSRWNLKTPCVKSSE